MNFSDNFSINRKGDSKWMFSLNSYPLWVQFNTMSKYSAHRLFKDADIERQYYANTMRVNLMALVQMTDDKYPWESGEWQHIYPYLSRFLNDADSDYGKTEEDYFNILSDFHKLSQSQKWVLDSLHDSLSKQLRKYVLPKPKSIEFFLPYAVTLILGVFLGWALF